MTIAKTHRILYVNHTGRVSGAEKILLNMLKGLDRSRYEPGVLCPTEGDLQGAVGALNVPCSPIPTLSARFTWRLDKLLGYLASAMGVIAAMRKQVALADPDRIHANTLRAGLVATVATWGTGRRIVWHVHDDLPRHPLSSIIRLLAYLSTGTRIVAVSESTARRFSGRLKFGDRLRVIHNGTDLSRFPEKRGGQSALKQELGLKNSDFLVCAVGQVCPRKGIRELIEAFVSIQADVPDLHIAVVGKPVFSHDEVYFHDLVTMTAARELTSRIHFTGERSDISSVLQSADLLVLNSLEEPFGLVLVEAMSSGTPVLAASVGGIPEIVTDSVSGWLVPKADTKALAERLRYLSTNQADLGRVARFARETVCPRFTLEAFLAKLHVFYAAQFSPHHSEHRSHASVLMNVLQNDKGDHHV